MGSKIILKNLSVIKPEVRREFVSVRLLGWFGGFQKELGRAEREYRQTPPLDTKPPSHLPLPCVSPANSSQRPGNLSQQHGASQKDSWAWATLCLQWGLSSALSGPACGLIERSSGTTVSIQKADRTVLSPQRGTGGDHTVGLLSTYSVLCEVFQSVTASNLHNGPSR